MRKFYFKPDEARDLVEWINLVEHYDNGRLDTWIDRLRNVLRHSSAVGDNVCIMYPDLKALYDWIEAVGHYGMVLIPEIPLDFSIITLKCKMYSYIKSTQKWIVETLTERSDVEREIIRAGAETIADLLIY